MATGAGEGDLFVGERARELRGILKLSYPTRHGVIQDWEDMHQLWAHMYHELNIVQDQHPVLLTEAPLNPKNNRSHSSSSSHNRTSQPTNQAIMLRFPSSLTFECLLLCCCTCVSSRCVQRQGCRDLLRNFQRACALRAGAGHSQPVSIRHASRTPAAGGAFGFGRCITASAHAGFCARWLLCCADTLLVARREWCWTAVTA